jgi:hypothetical protein
MTNKTNSNSKEKLNKKEEKKSFGIGRKEEKKVIWYWKTSDFVVRINSNLETANLLSPLLDGLTSS